MKTKKVKVVLSGMGGELETDVPFKLFHPRPAILDTFCFLEQF